MDRVSVGGEGPEVHSLTSWLFSRSVFFSFQVLWVCYRFTGLTCLQMPSSNPAVLALTLRTLGLSNSHSCLLCR